MSPCIGNNNKKLLLVVKNEDELLKKCTGDTILELMSPCTTSTRTALITLSTLHLHSRHPAILTLHLHSCHPVLLRATWQPLINLCITLRGQRMTDVIRWGQHHKATGASRKWHNLVLGRCGVIWTLICFRAISRM
jgi:hypothetical protein